MSATDPSHAEEMPAPLKTGAKWRFNPWLFIGALLMPGLLSLATLLILERDETYALGAFFVLLIGSGVAGIVSAVHFILSQPIRTTRARWGWGVLSFFLFTAAALILGVGGCAVVNSRLF